MQFEKEEQRGLRPQGPDPRGAGGPGTAASGAAAKGAAARGGPSPGPGARRASNLQPWSLGHGWQAHLAERDPAALARALTEADPLALRVLCAGRARHRHLLIDLDAAQVAAAARVVQALTPGGDETVPGTSDRVAFGAWLVEVVDGELDLLVESGARWPSGGPGDPGGVFELFGGSLGVTGRALCERCARFNRLPEAARRSFFRVAVEGKALGEAAALEGTALAVLGRRLGEALGALVGGGEVEA